MNSRKRLNQFIIEDGSQFGALEATIISNDVLSSLSAFPAGCMCVPRLEATPTEARGILEGRLDRVATVVRARDGVCLAWHVRRSIDEKWPDDRHLQVGYKLQAFSDRGSVTLWSP